mmetsp:Transcript_9805/g.32130  ORF Transcript_9805/g.32130 Transcript_9805/m.32130 type:complete len:210 (+) Transcript_9805:2063-2692(+)
MDGALLHKVDAVARRPRPEDGRHRAAVLLAPNLHHLHTARNVRELLLGEVFEHRDVLEELRLEALAVVFDGELLEHLAVERPELGGAGGFDGGGARGVVHQRQLAERVPAVVLVHHALPVVVLQVHLAHPLVKDVKKVASLALRDDGGARGVLLLKHAVDHLCDLLLVEPAEEHVVAHDGADPLLRLLRLFVLLRRLFLLVGIVDLRTD